MRICVLSVYTPNYDIGYKTDRINRKYCEKNGYDYKVFHTVHPQTCDKHPAWSKIPYIMDVMGAYDYVFWIDSDAFFCNHDKRIEDWIIPGKDICMCIDAGDGSDITRVNTGAMIVKNTKWTGDYLEQLVTSTQFIPYYRDDILQLEQGAIRKTLAEYPGVMGHVGVITDTNFNNNTNNVSGYIRNGGYILHMTNFNGTFPNQDRDDVVREYEYLKNV